MKIKELLTKTEMALLLAGRVRVYLAAGVYNTQTIPERYQIMVLSKKVPHPPGKILLTRREVFTLDLSLPYTLKNTTGRGPSVAPEDRCVVKVVDQATKKATYLMWIDLDGECYTPTLEDALVFYSPLAAAGVRDKIEEDMRVLGEKVKIVPLSRINKG